MVVTGGGPTDGLLDAYGAAPHGIHPPAGRLATHTRDRMPLSCSDGSSAEQTGTARRSAAGARALDGAAGERPT